MSKRSDNLKKNRKEYLEMAGKRCERCLNKVDLHIHHITYAQLCALPDDEQLASERIALTMEGEGCGEETAVDIMEKAQIPLFKT